MPESVSGLPHTRATQVREENVPEQDAPAQSTGQDLRSALRSLLEEDLSDQDLSTRLRALMNVSQGTAQPTTDEATDHPGYQ